MFTTWPFQVWKSRVLCTIKKALVICLLSNDQGIMIRNEDQEVAVHSTGETIKIGYSKLWKLHGHTWKKERNLST